MRVWGSYSFYLLICAAKSWMYALNLLSLRGFKWDYSFTCCIFRQIPRDSHRNLIGKHYNIHHFLLALLPTKSINEYHIWSLAWNHAPFLLFKIKILISNHVFLVSIDIYAICRNTESWSEVMSIWIELWSGDGCVVWVVAVGCCYFSGEDGWVVNWFEQKCMIWALFGTIFHLLPHKLYHKH